MSTATITPLRLGAVLEVGGMAQKFPSYAAAAAEAYSRGLHPLVDRFPPTSADVQVLAVAPALRVLT